MINDEYKRKLIETYVPEAVELNMDEDAAYDLALERDADAAATLSADCIYEVEQE